MHLFGLCDFCVPAVFVVTWCNLSYHCFAELVWSVGATKRTEIPLVVAGFVLCCFGFSEGLKHLPYPNFCEPELPSVSELCSSCGIRSEILNIICILFQYLHLFQYCILLYTVFCSILYFVVAREFTSCKDLSWFKSLI